MDKNIKFSVVIPLYNKARHIQRAINSVLNQNHQNFELIVVNDGSTDGSEKLVGQYSDARIKLINQVNGGESAARNRGIKEAQAQYIAFLDADDAWENYFLKTISLMIEAYPEVGGYATKIEDSKEAFSEYDKSENDEHKISVKIIDNYFAYLNNGKFPITSSSVCIKKEVMSRIGGFNQNLIIGPDIDMWIRVFLHSKFAFSTHIAAIYHTDADNRSVEREDFTQQELNFFVYVRNRYLIKSLDHQYYIELDQWIAKRMTQIVIRSIYKNQKLAALKIYLNNLSSFTLIQSFYILLRLIIPNILIEKIKLSKDISD